MCEFITSREVGHNLHSNEHSQEVKSSFTPQGPDQIIEEQPVAQAYRDAIPEPQAPGTVDFAPREIPAPLPSLMPQGPIQIVEEQPVAQAYRGAIPGMSSCRPSIV
ncbi:hypothetical protein EAI_16889 [Harpegnathos saltator]|uniref:Uncharacterized protein n=1 Tax=Harpegnathos saltator TaxID=610380 RepID=E2BYE5_HARSA|nr:hypothetical protein EAI_16889 [Harpegnathos saltator]